MLTNAFAPQLPQSCAKVTPITTDIDVLIAAVMGPFSVVGNQGFQRRLVHARTPASILR